MDVHLTEPDVSPLQLQGPKSKEIILKLFGERAANLKYYRFIEQYYMDIPLLISRTGWSSELGYEIFLRDDSKGNELWNKIMEVGQSFGLKPGHTSSIRRIEGAMLSYHADVDMDNNPFEMGLERLVDLDSDFDFIGKEALKKIRSRGINKKQVGLILNCDRLDAPNNSFWSLEKHGKKIGKITSAVYSPRLERNIALGIISLEFAEIGALCEVRIGGDLYPCCQVRLPFYDPNKELAKQ